MHTTKSNPLKSAFALAVCWSIVCCGPVDAAVSYLIADLIANQDSVTSGDKLFDQFTFSSTGDMPTANAVQVIGITDAAGNFGLRLFGGFFDQAGGGDSTLTVGYRVSVLDSSRAIRGSVLQGNATVVAEGSMRATSSFSEVPTTLTVFDELPGSTDLLDSAVFSSLFSDSTVQFSLVGNAIAPGSFVTGSFFDQTFYQTDAGVIPEPASLVIWMMTALFFGTVIALQRRAASQAVPVNVG